MKTAIVFGGSKSGNAVVRLLLSQGYAVQWADDGKINVDSDIDMTNITLLENGIPLSLRDARVDIIVKNPGIPDTHPVIAWLATRYFIYSEVDVAYLATKNFTYGAITGTNGKTTTTSLLHHLLSGEETPAYVAGNIGTPLSDVVTQHGDEKANIALELSSFQIDGLLFFQPKVATILNLSPDHLDRYLLAKFYYDSKFKLIKQLGKDSIFLRNIDDPEIMSRARYLKAQIIDFSLKEKADVFIDGDQVFYKDVELFKISELPIKGLHNVQNAMVAVMMASIMGVDLEAIRHKLKTFEAVKHRLQLVKTIDGISYYNDSKGTNPDATMVALKSFEQPVILLLGGYDKKISYDVLLGFADKIKHVVVFGQTKDQLKALFPEAYVTENLDEAFSKAVELAVKGDTILFSPASASFDQYKNYEERGDHFISLVENLEK